MEPATIAAIVGGASAALQTGGGLFSNLLHRNDARNPYLQSQTGLAQAAGDTSYLSSMFPALMAYNDKELAHNIQTYQNLGLNPQLAIPQQAATQTAQSIAPNRQQADTSIDLASAFQPLMAIAPIISQLQDMDLDRESKELDLEKKKQDLWIDLDNHNLNVESHNLRMQDLSDQIARNKEQHRAYMDNMLAKSMSENERARLIKLQADYQELMNEKERYMKEYYEEVARLQKEGLERDNALKKAQTSQAYAKVQECNSKIALNNAKVSMIESDIDSDPANHTTAVIDDIVDPEKHPTLNHVLKAGALTLQGAAGGIIGKYNPFAAGKKR